MSNCNDNEWTVVKGKHRRKGGAQTRLAAGAASAGRRPPRAASPLTPLRTVREQLRESAEAAASTARCERAERDVRRVLRTLTAEPAAVAELAALGACACAAAAGGDAPCACERHLICYGLGSVLRSARSRAQLAFLLHLQRVVAPRRTLLFEPIMSAAERAWLRTAFHIDAPDDVNDSGRRAVRCKTLFFMPHCPRALYHNVLRANLDANALAENVAVIGNSFERYELRSVSSDVRELRARAVRGHRRSPRRRSARSSS